jgi:integrase/recombinase XerC
LLAGGHGSANEIALSYRAHLEARRLAALRSVVKMGRTLGLVSWALEVEGPRNEAYRDTRGPGREGFRRMLACLEGRTDAKGLRDRAVLRLLYDLGLRRKEVVGIDLADLDLQAGTVLILGKGRTQQERLTLPKPTLQAIQGWLTVRPAGGDALFVSLSRFRPGHRLTGKSVYQIVRALGERAGIHTRPHGLRHAAISEALNAFNGNVREVKKFSRHRRLDTLMIYDDARQDTAGKIAQRLAEDAA